MRILAVLASLLVALGSAVCVPTAATADVGPRVRVLDPDAPYPEGPLRRAGRLYYTDYASSTITVLHHGEERTFWHQPGCGPSGLLAMPRRGLLVTCYDSNTLVELDRRGEVRRTTRTDSAGRPFLGPNDLARDAHGGIYFSASGVYDVDAPVQGKVYYLAPDGSIRPVARNIHYSNGLAVTPDGKHLLVAEMLADRVLSFAISDHGSLGERRVLADMQDVMPGPPHSDPYTGPDGLKVDERGRLYVAENGTGQVVVLDAAGEYRASAHVPARYVTNVALGPGHRVYVTAAYDANNEPYPGAVFEVRLG